MNCGPYFYLATKRILLYPAGSRFSDGSERYEEISAEEHGCCKASDVTPAHYPKQYPAGNAYSPPGKNRQPFLLAATSGSEGGQSQQAQCSGCRLGHRIVRGANIEGVDQRA